MKTVETQIVDVVAYAAGQDWLRNSTYRSRENLLSFFANMSGRDYVKWLGARDGFTLLERFYFVLDPDCDGDREAAASFWAMNGLETNRELADSFDETGFVVEFIEGICLGGAETGEEDDEEEDYSPIEAMSIEQQYAHFLALTNHPTAAATLVLAQAVLSD